MNNLKKIYCILFLISTMIPTLAFANKVLDKVEIVQVKTETEIHIEFLTQVRYLRHFPNNLEASRVQIYLDFPQSKTLSTEREFINSPKNDLVPSFVVNFPDQKENSIGVRFREPVKFTITPDNNGRGIVIHVPTEENATELNVQVKEQSTVGVALGEVPAKPAGMTDNDYAGKLVADSKTARGNGDYAKAIQLLNAALNLPANNYSQEAQELIGNSREKMGEKLKAKAEYETYLKLYPTGEGANRVRERIAVIDSTMVKSNNESTSINKKVFKEVHENSVYGSLTQYYYDAHTHNYPGSAPATTSHDQSSLVSAIDLTARFRQNEWDNKIVVRDTQTMNFLPRGEDRNRLQAAYVEVNNKESDYLARLGRQNGNSGGVLGRFDGALFRYGLSPKYKLNFVAGTLNEYKVDYRRHFYGINLDIGPINDKWSGNAFFIEQRVDRQIDRRGVGGELRYFDNGKSIYSLLDYDTYYNRLNTAMVQGNWQTEDGTNFNMLIDHRKSPVLQLINGLSDPAYGLPPYTSFPTNLNQTLAFGQTESGLRESAIKQTLDTNLVLLGATKQVTPRWQLGGDVQMSRVSGSPGATQGAIELAKKAALEAGTILDPLTLQNLNNSFAGGNTYTYHLQAVGTDTLFHDDTSVISASITSGPTSLVQSLVFTNVMVPYDKWRLDSSMKLLKIDSDPSTVQYIMSPTIRASYRMRDKATIEAEVGIEVTNENDFTNGHTRTFRDFSFIGYRLDL